MLDDVVHITIQIMVGKVFQIIKLAIIILHICYFSGTIWFIICLLTNDYQDKYFEYVHPDLEIDETENRDNFIDYYNILDYSESHNMILGTYYAFTTLSTVGFGDLAPRSDLERIVCAFILMMGVAIFSVFLGNFTLILE
jgi:hypothetical protein